MTAMEIEGTFDVVGAQSALAFFTTLPAARLGHGYLFTGPAGVGKKTFARRLAQSLLCETPKRSLLGYCGRCTGCTLFVAGTHPDFVFAEGTIKIGKDGGSALHDEDLTARDLVRELSLHGYRSRYRVVLLGDVAFATHEAANALLKFFEEPPSGVVVLLTTNAPGSLLATIRSRFVELPFGPLPTRDVERVLTTGGVAPEKARLAAEVSLGSVVRARAFLDEDQSGTREASYAWFARAVRGEPVDSSFLRLDDRSSDRRRETRAGRRTDRTRPCRRARLDRAPYRRRRRPAPRPRSTSALRALARSRSESARRVARRGRRCGSSRAYERFGRARRRVSPAAAQLAVGRSQRVRISSFAASMPCETTSSRVNGHTQPL